jgi:hypothetical protein
MLSLFGSDTLPGLPEMITALYPPVTMSLAGVFIGKSSALTDCSLTLRSIICKENNISVSSRRN